AARGATMLERRCWRAAAAIGAAALALSIQGAARAEVPGTLTHQGRLYDEAGAPVNATKNLKFAIYANANDAAPLWDESIDVTFEDGYFSVSLGAGTPFDKDLFDGSERYLGITIDGDAEMTPRASIASVPYALVAGNAIGDITPSTVSIAG